MNPRSLVIEWLKQKQVLTPLEQDILDTCNELSKTPSDLSAMRLRSFCNEVKYPEIGAAGAALPTTVQKPAEQITEKDLTYILSAQLEELLRKESEVMRNGQ